MKVGKFLDFNAVFCILDAHITQDGIVYQVPEVLHRSAEIARDIHVIIDRKPHRAPTKGRIGKRRFPHLCSKAETRKIRLCLRGHVNEP